LVANLLEIKNSARLVEEIVHKGAFKDVFGRTPDKPSVVQSTLGSLAKALYDNLFNWLVAKMNESILPEDTKNKMTIGLLDIFGFENF
jgi:myosin-1